MGLFNSVPLYLDNQSGYTLQQVTLINTIVRVARRAFEAKAKQVQLTQPKIEKLSAKTYNRVLDLRDYLYNKSFSMNFILNPVGFQKDGEYPLFETDYDITFLQMQGSNSDTKPDKTLGALGYLTISTVSLRPTVMFHCSTDDWPTDSGGNKVQYSVYISGVIS